MCKVALPICQTTLHAGKPNPQGYPALPRSLGEHIKRRRLELSLFQRDVGRQVGCDESSVLNWEKGRNEPELKFIPAILAFLGYDPRPPSQSVGQCLVRYRESRGWSQKRLARELDVDPTTLSRWELGKKAPRGPYQVRVTCLLKPS